MSNLDKWPLPWSVDYDDSPTCVRDLDGHLVFTHVSDPVAKFVVDTMNARFELLKTVDDYLGATGHVVGVETQRRAVIKAQRLMEP